VTPTIAAASGIKAVVTRLTGAGAAAGHGVGGAGLSALDDRPDTHRFFPSTHAVVALTVHRVHAQNAL